MGVIRLRTVDALIAIDLDDCPTSAGGTRFAPDVSEREARLLARAMTYKFAVLGRPVGGAKGAVRGAPEDKADLMKKYCEEIAPLVAEGRFLTGPDLGTSEADFAPIRHPDAPRSVMTETVDGVAFEDVLTGFGVVAAAEAAIGSLDGLAVAVEGFGKVGGGVAREAVRRGARVVAVSTIAGCLHDPDGLDVSELWALRDEYGDDLVRRTERPSLPASALFDIPADVLVPGARIGVVDEGRAAGLPVRAVVPAANVPYGAGAVGVLASRGVIALADFVCNAGAVIGYLSPAESTPQRVMHDVEQQIGDLVRASLDHPDGPYAGASAAAEAYLRTWREPDGLPGGPPTA